MLDQLPAEIALHAMSYLPLHSLYLTTQVSREWNSFISHYESTVYRNAAILHRFVDRDQLGAGSVPCDWKAYCRRQLEIERGWRGKAPSVVRELTAAGSAVHRIKVDYELGFVITTSQLGGLSVCDIKNNCVLWSLPSTHVVHFAHCEYDRGYIVFNRNDNCKEVWRRTVDADDDPLPVSSPPDMLMLEASAQAATTFNSLTAPGARFKAWALLHMPEHTRAFRFLYPTLLAAAKNNAYLWDIPSSQMNFVIQDIQRLYRGVLLAAINYVEVNDLYVFICGGSGGLRIFERENGALVYQLSTLDLSSPTWDVVSQTQGLASTIVRSRKLIHESYYPSSYNGEFIACHVSASGNDLIALTSNGRLVFLPDFHRLFSGSRTVHHRDIAIVLNFQPFSSVGETSCYLAVGNRNGKLAVATQKGIYLISPDIDFNRLTADRPTEQPGVSVCQLSKFEHERWLSSVSCIQVTHDAVYFTYKPSQFHDILPHIADHAHLHGVGGGDDGQGQIDVVNEMEDGFANGWEDEESEEDDMAEDPMQDVIADWFASDSTVYRVGF